MNFAYYFSQKFYFPMKLDKINTEELMELIELVIEDDTHLKHSLCSSDSNNFYSKETNTLYFNKTKNQQKIQVGLKKKTNYLPRLIQDSRKYNNSDYLIINPKYIFNRLIIPRIT